MDAPRQLDTLRRQPDLWPNAVEEILRLDSPVQLTARVALDDVTVAGTPITRGDLVVIYLAAANRDPAVFTDPHRFARRVTSLLAEAAQTAAAPPAGATPRSRMPPDRTTPPSRRRGPPRARPPGTRRTGPDRPPATFPAVPP